MAIITYEGFENYSSFDAVKSYFNYTNFGTMSFISSTDTNSVTPRNSGSCLKFISVNNGTYPKFLLTSPNSTTNTSGVFGFSWYNLLPAGGSWGTFTPICGVIDNANKPLFYIGVNSNGSIEARRWIHRTQGLIPSNAGDRNTSSTLWNTFKQCEWDCGKNGCGNAYLPLFDVTNNYSLLGATTSLITANAWNYIEVKYSLSNTSSGYIHIKINRNSNDATLDLNLNNIATSPSTNPAMSLVFGIHRGHATSSDGFNVGTNTAIYTSYFDDIYWADLTGSNNNNFLGRVNCKKFSYNEVASYDMTTPANSGTALSNFNETFSGIGTISTSNTGNVVGQTLDVKSNGVGSETLSPTFVRQYVHGYKTETNSDIAIGATNGADNIAVTGVGFNSDSINGTLKFRDYDNAPDGTEWTNQKIADTTFKHTIIAS
jgi:hypothetical protein